MMQSHQQPFLANTLPGCKRSMLALWPEFSGSEESAEPLFLTDALAEVATQSADLVFFSGSDEALLYCVRAMTAAVACREAVETLIKERGYGASAEREASLLRRAAAAQERLAILARGEVAVFEQVQVTQRLSQVAVLDAILDAPALTLPVLAAFIEAFRAGGERGYRREVALYFDARVLDSSQLPPEPKRVSQAAA